MDAYILLIFHVDSNMAPNQHREFYEWTPLIASASITSLNPQAWWNSWKRYLQGKRHAARLYFEGVRYAWPLVWPSEEDGHRHRLYLCGVMSFLQRILYILVPYLLGRVVNFLPLLDPEMLRTPIIWVQVFGLYVSGFVRDYLCKRVQSWLWLPCSLRSEQVFSGETLQTVLDNPKEELRWASGGFLSDFNKGGSLNKCLEEILFTWIPLLLDLFTTTIYIWIFLGPIYGLVIAVISSWYVYSIACNAQRSVYWSRDVVEAKRMKDAVAYVSLCLNDLS
jgi:ABC-type multidrug transport system fused ATPase/permease subunit